MLCSVAIVNMIRDKDMETTDVLVQTGMNRYRRYYPIILGLSLAITVFLAVYVNLILGIELVYSHLFYIPIILAGIWYHRKAIYLALYLGVLHIALSYMSSGLLMYESFLRALIFVATAYIVGTIAARKDLLYDGLKASRGQSPADARYPGAAGPGAHPGA